MILAEVYDVKNLKLKIRPEENRQYNSPWNIAARFNIEMSFSAGKIAGMLREYEDEQHTGMDADRMARYVYDYTPGYPRLVSAICKFLEQLEIYPDLKNVSGQILYEGKKYPSARTPSRLIGESCWVS